VHWEFQEKEATWTELWAKHMAIHIAVNNTILKAGPGNLLVLVSLQRHMEGIE
jgi:hypothetical protein